jgi:hypothetical protein
MLGIRATFTELSSTVFVFLTEYYLGDQTKEDGMGAAYGKYGGTQKCIWDSGQKPQGKRPLEDLGTQWVILEYNIKNFCQSHLQQEKLIWNLLHNWKTSTHFGICLDQANHTHNRSSTFFQNSGTEKVHYTARKPTKRICLAKQLGSSVPTVNTTVQ